MEAKAELSITGPIHCSRSLTVTFSRAKIRLCFDKILLFDEADSLDPAKKVLDFKDFP